MSDFCIHIKLNDYLAQWFINSHGGQNPVRLLKGSIESKVLSLYLTKRPPTARPVPVSKMNVSIVIPCFRTKPPEYFNYLPHYAYNALVKEIINRFDVDLFSSLHAFGHIGKKQKDLVYAWMEARGIEDSPRNWDAIVKRYQRLRNVYKNNERNKIKYNSKKNH